MSPIDPTLDIDISADDGREGAFRIMPETGFESELQAALAKPSLGEKLSSMMFFRFVRAPVSVKLPTMAENIGYRPIVLQPLRVIDMHTQKKVVRVDADIGPCDTLLRFESTALDMDDLWKMRIWDVHAGLLLPHPAPRLKMHHTLGGLGGLPPGVLSP